MAGPETVEQIPIRQKPYRDKCHFRALDE